MKKGKMILWALLLIVFWVVAIGVWVLFGDSECETSIVF